MDKCISCVYGHECPFTTPHGIEDLYHAALAIGYEMPDFEEVVERAARHDAKAFETLNNAIASQYGLGFHFRFGYSGDASPPIELKECEHFRAS